MKIYLVKSKFTFRNLYGNTSIREITNLVEASSKEKVGEIVSKHIMDEYKPISTALIKIVNVEVFDTLSETENL